MVKGTTAWLIFYLMYMSVLLACRYTYHMHVWCLCLRRRSERVTNPLRLKLHMVEGHRMGARTKSEICIRVASVLNQQVIPLTLIAWRDGSVIKRQAALPEDLGSIPSTDMAPQTVCKFS